MSPRATCSASDAPTPSAAIDPGSPDRVLFPPRGGWYARRAEDDVGGAPEVTLMDRILRHIEVDRDSVEDWASYPFSIPAITSLDRIDFDRGVTFLVGENGSGKSTIIEAIAIKAGFNPEGGSKSHGEAFLWVMMNRFQANGLYLLDEPEAALSPTRQLTFLGRMHQLIRGGSQFVIATHSPILMGYPGARIYLLDARGANEVRYEETEHYAVTRTFLQDPARMLRDVFAAAESE